MKKLFINKLANIRKSNSKGFTLVELIVVIVIIAILMAALAPAILGVIGRANESADLADLNTVIMAGSMVGMDQTPPGTPTLSAMGTNGAYVIAQISGGANAVTNGTYTLHFDGAIVIGGRLVGGRSGATIIIGDFPDYNIPTPADTNSFRSVQVGP